MLWVRGRMCVVVVCATRFGITTRAEFKSRYDLTGSKTAGETGHSPRRGEESPEPTVVMYGFPALSTLVSSSGCLGSIGRAAQHGLSVFDRDRFQRL